MNGAFPLLDLDACRRRQGRLIEIMAAQRLDLVVAVMPEHVEYLTGHRWDHRFAPLVALTAQGTCLLVCPDKPPSHAAADDICVYEAKWRSTLRNDQRESAAAIFGDWLDRRSPRRVGVEFSACPPHVTNRLDNASLADIEPSLYEMRRRKDPDELIVLRTAIAACGAMYDTARSMIAPGVNELDVFSRLQATAVGCFGEMLTGTGNDYACGMRGGPPRDRLCEAGELYILDLGPAYRGYFADTSRAIAVDGHPTDLQLIAWERVCGALRLVEERARPGVRGRAIYDEVFAWLGDSPVGSWSSHLGHGIGLFPHEAPHLNPSWDDVLQEGEVIAVEPALYDPVLRTGMRLENDYLVTATGVENLSPFPLDLV